MDQRILLGLLKIRPPLWTSCSAYSPSPQQSENILDYTSTIPVPTLDISLGFCNIPTQKPLLGQGNGPEDFWTQKHRSDDGRHGPLRAGTHNALERLYYLVCLSVACQPSEEELNVVVILDISLPHTTYFRMQALRIALPDLLAFLENFKNSYSYHLEAKEGI